MGRKKKPKPRQISESWKLPPWRARRPCMGGLRPMCPAKHAQSWGSLQERKGWVGGGYTKLNNSRKSTEQGLNFPLLLFEIFQPRPKQQQRDETEPVLLRNSSGWQQTGWAGRRPHGKSIMVNPDVTIRKNVAVFQRGPTCGTFSQLESEVISGTWISNGPKEGKRDSERRWRWSSDPPDAFTRVPAFRGESQQVWHLSVFKSKQLKDRWPNIPEMTPCPSAILLRPNCELGRAASTVMDIDHPEEFFEAWQPWRFSQGSINCIDRTVRRCFLHRHLVRWDAPPGHDWHLFTYTCFVHRLWFLNVLKVCMAFKLSLRGRLTCFQVLSEKPDKTPPFKPFFWPLLIIHSVWRRRETLSEGLLSRPLRARFALRSRPERLLFISSVLQVVPVISDTFLSTFSLLLCWKYLPLSRTVLLWQEETLPFMRPGRRNRSCLVRGDGLFPASAVTHAHSTLAFLLLRNSFCSWTHFLECLRSTSVSALC